MCGGILGACLVGVDGFDELVAQLEDGQALALLLDGPHVVEAKGGRLAQRLGLPLRHLKPTQPNAAQLLRSAPRLSAFSIVTQPQGLHDTPILFDEECQRPLRCDYLALSRKWKHVTPTMPATDDGGDYQRQEGGVMLTPKISPALWRCAVMYKCTDIVANTATDH